MLTQAFADHGGECVRLTLDLGLIVTFYHYASQILSARITKQETPPARQLIFNVSARVFDGSDFRKRPLLTNFHVNQYLRISNKAGGHFRKRLACATNGFEHEKRRHHPVADQAFTRKNNMAGLLSSEFGSAPKQLVENKLIAYSRPNERQADR